MATAVGRPQFLEIRSRRARRDRQPELQEQFICDPLVPRSKGFVIGISLFRYPGACPSSSLQKSSLAAT